MHCTINRDLPDGCEYQTGGIDDNILIYDLAKASLSLEFEGDKRLDDNNLAITIQSDQDPYILSGRNWTYGKEYDRASGYYTHTLTGNVLGIDREEDELLHILQTGNSRYIAVFKPEDSPHYLLIGYIHGVQANVTETIDQTENVAGYSVTLSGQSEFSTIYVDSINFSFQRPYKPLFEPLYSVSYCMLKPASIERTGYKLAKYVVKQNEAGQALDEDDRLCSQTGKPQVAYVNYRFENVGTEYQIIGTYQDDAEFNGKPVVVYDILVCSPTITDSLSVTPSEIRLTGTHTRESVTVTSTGGWRIINYQRLPINMYDVLGSAGETEIAFWVDNRRAGGEHLVEFINDYTRERETLKVLVTRFLGDYAYEVEYGTPSLDIEVDYDGISPEGWEFMAGEGLNITRQGNVLHIAPVSVFAPSTTYTITLKSTENTDETKEITISIGEEREDSPKWEVIASACVLKEE